MTEKVVLALMAKRAEIQGYIQDLETKARRWRARLAHVDATLTIFSPETDPEAIQPNAATAGVSISEAASLRGCAWMFCERQKGR